MLSADALDALEDRIDAWFAREAAANPMIAAVDRGERGERRWYVRVRGEQKDTFTLWFTLLFPAWVLIVSLHFLVHPPVASVAASTSDVPAD